MEARPLKIFAASNTSRLRYTADLILGEILGLRWEIVTDKRKLGKHHVINYSCENIPDSLNIRPEGLLSEEGTRHHDIETGEWNRLPAIFITRGDSDIPFDLFSAVFYLVTRYEEYLGHEPDQSGQFPASASIAFRNGFLGIPVVDFWSRELAVMLVKKFHNLTFRRKEFRRLTVIDVDIHVVTHKIMVMPVPEELSGEASQFIREAKDIDQDWNKEGKDFDEIIGYITEKAKNNNSELRLFFSLGDYGTVILPEKKKHRVLIRRFSESGLIGLSFSGQALPLQQQVESEFRELSELTGEAGRSVIFRWKALSLPLSYRSLIQAGINEDFSMGYHDIPGFRAGISRPFFFYDLVEERQTFLRVFPSHDSFTASEEGGTGVKEHAGENIRNLIREVRKAGGTFVSVWHHEILGPGEECRQWRDLFEFTMNEQAG